MRCIREVHWGIGRKGCLEVVGNWADMRCDAMR